MQVIQKISMIAIGIGIITLFSLMFYLEDRDGGGVYDPDPRPHKTK